MANSRYHHDVVRELVGLREQLNDAEVTERSRALREIRRRYEAGDIAQARLAEEFGVCGASISYIVRGLHWRVG